MPAPCSSCQHEHRDQLDRELVLGAESLRGLARRYGVDRASLARHRDNHLSAALVKVQTEREEAGPRSALDDLRELRARALRILDAAENDGKASLSLSALRELRGIVELTARVTGELREAPRVALVLTQSTEWQEFRDRLLAALAPYPEIEEHVLRELSASTDAPPSETGAIAVGCSAPVQSMPRGVS